MFQSKLSEESSDRRATLQLDLAFMNAELGALGFEDILTLGNNKRKYTAKQYAKVVPLLLKWFSEAPRRDTQSIILSALRTRSARPLAAHTMIEAFNRFANVEKPYGLGWEIGDALSYVADDSVADDLIEIARNTNYGKDRQMAVLALGNLKDGRVGQVLCDLLSDDDVYLHALCGLAKLGYPPARPLLEPFLSHETACSRKKAQQAIAKINKKQKSNSTKDGTMR